MSHSEKEKISREVYLAKYAKWHCKVCNNMTPAIPQSNGELEPCLICTEKKKKEEKEKIIKAERADMYRKTAPVQSGISFADMLKKRIE